MIALNWPQASSARVSRATTRAFMATSLTEIPLNAVLYAVLVHGRSRQCSTICLAPQCVSEANETCVGVPLWLLVQTMFALKYSSSIDRPGMLCAAYFCDVYRGHAFECT